MTRWGWVMVCTVLAGFLMFLRIGIRESLLYEFRDVKVQKTAPYEYWLAPKGKQPFHTTVCRDYYEPGFDTGMTLTRAVFVDQGDCWSLNPNKHAGYFIERGQDGRPIIATSN